MVSTQRIGYKMDKQIDLLIDMFFNDDAKFSNFRLKINTNNVQKNMLLH